MVETISREEAAWLAGIIEGEGSIMFPRHKLAHGKVSYRASVAITNTDYRMIKKVSEIFFKLGCKFYYQIKKTKNGFAMAIHSVGRNSTDKILDLVMPFLVCKKDQAELVKDFNSKMGQGRYQTHGVEYYDKIQVDFREKMSGLRVKSINPQRLKRTASQPLEMMV